MMNAQSNGRAGFKLSLLAAAVMGASGLAAVPSSALADQCETVDNTTTCTGTSSQNLSFDESPHAVVVEGGSVVTRDDGSEPIISMDVSGGAQTEGFGLFSVENLGTIGDDQDDSIQPAIRVRGNPDAEDATDDAVGVTSFSLNNVGAIHGNLSFDGMRGDIDIDNAEDAFLGSLTFSDLSAVVESDPQDDADPDVSVTGTLENAAGGSVNLTNAGTIGQPFVAAAGEAVGAPVSGSLSISNAAGGNVSVENLASGTMHLTGAFQLQSREDVTDTVTTTDTSGESPIETTVTTERQAGGDVSLVNAGVIDKTGGGGPFMLRAAGDVNFENSGTVDSPGGGPTNFNAGHIQTVTTVETVDGVETFNRTEESLVEGSVNINNSGYFRPSDTQFNVTATGDIDFTNAEGGEIEWFGSNPRALLIDARHELTATETVTSIDAGVATFMTQSVTTQDGGDIAFENAGTVSIGRQQGPNINPRDLTLLSASNVSFNNSGSLGNEETPIGVLLVEAGSQTVTSETVTVDEILVSEEQVTSSQLGDISFVNTGDLVVQSMLLDGRLVEFQNPGTIRSTGNTLNINAGSVDTTTVIEAPIDEVDDDRDADGVGDLKVTETSSQAMTDTAVPGEVVFVNAADGSITGGDVNINAVGDVSFTNFGSVESDVNIDNRVILTESESNSMVATTTTFEAELDEDGEPTGDTQTSREVVEASSSESQTQEVFQGEVSVDNQGSIGGSLNVNQSDLGNLLSFNRSSDQTTTTDFVAGEAAMRTTEFTTSQETTNEAPAASAGGTITHDPESVVSSDVLINALEDTAYNNLGTVVGDVTINTVGTDSGTATSETSVFVQDVSDDAPPVSSLFLFPSGSPGTPGTPNLDPEVPAFLGSGADYTAADGPLVEAESRFTVLNTSSTVGGNASLNNVSFDSIGGDVAVTGLNQASVNNSGLIRGDVAIDAGGSQSSFDTDFTFDRETTITDDTVVVVDEAFGVLENRQQAIGGSAALDNSGTIGEVTIDQDGNIDIDGGQVSVSATETASVSNTATGLIFGNVSATASGTDSVQHLTNAWEHETVIDADSGDVVSQTANFEAHVEESEMSVASSATVVNEGEIGRQLTQNDGAAVNVVGSQAVSAEATEASVVNTGSILSGVFVQGSGTSSELVTSRSLDFNRVTDEDGVTTQTVLDGETLSATEGGVGASAALENSGSIGAEDLAGFTFVDVFGQAEATLENTGDITGSDVSAFASSITVSAQEMIQTEDSTETFEETQVDGVPVSSERHEDSLETQSVIGGTALLDNAGSIAVNSVSVSGDPATLTNSGTLTAGSVNLNSVFTSTSEQTITTTTMSATAPTAVATQRDDSTTTSGGVASLENTGTLSGAVSVAGFEAATVSNAADAAINGSVTVTSRGVDTTFESDTVFQDGEQTGSFTSTTTQVGGVAAVANQGTIDGSVTANGFAGSEVDNAVTGLIAGGVTLGGSQGSYVNTVNEDGSVTQTPAGPALGEGGTETVLSNAGVIQGSVNARAFTLNTIDNSGQMGHLTVSAFGSSNEIVNTGVMGSVNANAGDTDILNTGIITGSVNFNAPGSVNSLTMASGSHIASGSVTAATDSTTGEPVTSTAIELQGLGLFSGNVSGVESLTRSGEGTWVLTGSGSSSADPTTATYDIAEIDIVAGGIQFGGSFGEAGPTPGSPFQQPGFLAGNTALDPRFLDVVNDTLAGAGQSGTNTVINVEGNIDVGEDGELSGEFALFGDLEVAGTFTPGFVTTRSNPRTAGPEQLPFIAPGQVQIEGDYTLAGGTHAIGFGPELRSLGGGDFAEESLATNMTTVSGDANLGSTLSVLVEPGLYVDGQSAAFLQVSGELDGDGLSVAPTMNPRFVNFAVTTSEDEGVTVASVTATRDSFTTAAASENEAAAAGALDASVADVVDTLRTADRDSDAFRSATMLGRVITQLDFGGLSDEQVSATFGDFAPGFLASLNALDVSRPVLSSTMRRASGRFVAPEQERGISGWAEGHVLNDRMDASGGAAGIESDFHGLSAGLEARDINSLIGLAFGYSDISVKGRGNTDRADVEAKTLGLYGGYRNGPWTVNGQVGFTWSNFETRRALGGMLPDVIGGLAGTRVATADYDSTEWNVSAEVAYDFILDNGVTVSPLAELRYRDRSVDSYQEEVGGVALLDVDSNSGSMWIPTIGVEASSEMSFGDWNVRPMGGLRYAFVPGSDEEIDVRMIGTNSVYETRGAEMDDQLVVNAGVELDRNNLSIFGGANVGFTGDQRTFQFNAGLRYRF